MQTLLFDNTIFIMKKFLNRFYLLHILAFIGIICTVELAVIYYQSNFNLYSVPSFCSINSFIDCDGVAQTSASVFLGIPLCYWGLLFYSFVLILLHADKIKNVKYLDCFSVFKTPYSYISVLGMFSFLISAILAIISVFKLQKLCILCVFTYFVNFAIALVSTDFNNGGFAADIRTSWVDFVHGLKKYGIHLLIVLFIFSLFLSYTTINMPFASRKESIKYYMNLKKNPYKTTGNSLGNESANIVVHLYTDFGCPICPTYNIMIHKLVRENKNIKVVHHQFPLDNECNHYLTSQMHEGGCRMARYSIAAENQGKYWDMSELLFESKPKNDSSALELAKQLNLDIEKFVRDINSFETKIKLQKEIDDAISKGIDGTPTVLVQEKRFFGAKSYYEFKTLIMKGSND